MADNFIPKQNRRNPYFEALLKEGTNTSPIGAHSQGMSRLAFALLAGLERGQMDREQRGGPADVQWKGPGLSQQAHHVMPWPSPVEPNPPSAADATTPASPPAQMPLVLGSSGQPIPQSGIVGNPINIFDPRSLNRYFTRRPPLQPPGFRRDVRPEITD